MTNCSILFDNDTNIILQFFKLQLFIEVVDELYNVS